MSEEQAGKRRRRRSGAEAQQLVTEYEAGGLSREEFFQRHELALSTLARYRRRLRQPQGEACGASRWLAVGLSGPGPAAASSALAP